MRAGRFISIVAGLVLVLATYLLGRSVWPRRPELGLMAAAFAAFLPESLFVGGAMSNDMFAAMWATLALWLSLRAENWKHALLAGLCLGLAVVSKASTGSLAPVVGVVLLVGAWPNAKRGWSGLKPLLPAAGRVLIAGIATLAVVAPWLWRNWRLYGDPFGWSIVLATIDRRQGPLGLADVGLAAQGLVAQLLG